jgi:hypothetical protein
MKKSDAIVGRVNTFIILPLLKRFCMGKFQTQKLKNNFCSTAFQKLECG